MKSNKIQINKTDFSLSQTLILWITFMINKTDTDTFYFLARQRQRWRTQNHSAAVACMSVPVNICVSTRFQAQTVLEKYCDDSRKPRIELCELVLLDSWISKLSYLSATCCLLTPLYGFPLINANVHAQIYTDTNC